MVEPSDAGDERSLPRDDLSRAYDELSLAKDDLSHAYDELSLANGDLSPAVVARASRRDRRRFAEGQATRGASERREAAWGSDTTKTVPLGLLSSMRMSPECASTSLFTMDRPRPVPPYSRVLDESTW